MIHFNQWTKAKMERLWKLQDIRGNTGKYKPCDANLTCYELQEYTSLMNEYEENRIQHEHQKGLSSQV